MGLLRLFSKNSVISCAISLLLTVTALLLCYNVEDLFYFTLHQQMKLTEGSRAVKLWSEPPEQTISFYFFNWTNPEEYGVKPPELKEIGPFKYRMLSQKVNVVSNDNDTLSYNMQRYWFFDSEGSVGPENFLITTLNPVLTSAAHILRFAGFFRKRAFALGLKAYNAKHYVTIPTRELLFDGISDPLLETASYFQSLTSFDVPFDKFGWFYDRNGTYYLEGTFNVGSGNKDLNDVTKIHRWDWKSRTPYYEGSCGLVNGSTGELFPQRLVKTDILEFFMPDFCRTLRLYYKEEAHVRGILGYKFVVDSRNLDNGTLDETSICFCGGECSPVGVQNMTVCRYGVPAFTSLPHFLDGDRHYLNGVKGMTPDEKRHEFYVIVEPNTGITLDATMRFQANFLTMPHDYISILSKAPEIYFPMVWSELRSEFPEHLALELQLGLLVLNYGALACLCLAFICFLPFVFLLFTGKCFSKKIDFSLPAPSEQPLIELKK